MMRFDLSENGILLTLLGGAAFASVVAVELAIETRPETPLRISVDPAAGWVEDEADESGASAAADGSQAGEDAEEATREARVAEFRARAEAAMAAPDTTAASLVSLGRESRKLDEMVLAERLFDRAAAVDAKSADARYWRARTRSDLGRTADAITDFRAVLSMAPNHQRATFYLGALLHQEGKLAEAHQHLERASNISSGRLKARSLRQLALVLMDEKKPAEAIPLLVRSVNLRPDAADYWFDLGRAQSAVGEADKALEAMRKATALDAQLAEAQFAYGVMLERRGDHKAALSALAAAVRVDEDDPLIHEARARILLANGRTAEAAQEFAWLGRNATDEARLAHAQGQVEVLTGDAAAGVRLLLESDDRDRGARDAMIAGAALHLFDTGSKDQAGLLVARLKSRPARDVAAGFETAALAVRLGDWDWAASRLRAALEAVPTRSDGWFLLGRVRSELGDSEGAVTAYRQSIAHNTEAKNARLNLGVLLARLGRRDEALALYNELLERHPRYATALYNRALLHASVGHTEQAISDFESVVSADPEHVRARERLARLLLENGQVSEALGLLEDAVQQAPGESQLRVLLGIARLDSGDREGAFASLRRAEALAGEHAPTWRRIAEAWSRAGETTRAEEARAKAASPAPRN